MLRLRIAILYILLLPFTLFANSKTSSGEDVLNNEKTRILFIIDCSYNMNEKWQSGSKIKITQSLISNIVDSIDKYDNVEIGLRVFGNEKDYSIGDCDDTQLLVPFYRQNGDNIKAKLKALVPKGISTVARSLEKASEDFPKEKNCRNIIIMIVDNIDKCDGDVAMISQQMQKKGIYIKPFIIGISKGMKNNYEDCGNYYEVKGEIDFSRTLNNIIKQALHSTIVQINLLDINNENTETNIPITFYDSESKMLRYTFIHTLGYNGVSETMSIDPLIQYDIVANTIPPVKKEKVSIQAGTRTSVSLKTPQGTLALTNSSNKTLTQKNYPVIIKKAGQKATINVQNIGSKEKYLVGKYDLEVLSLPRLEINNVEISQSSITTIEIPNCGLLKIDKQSRDIGGSIFMKEKNETKWVKNLSIDVIKEAIELLPGNYVIVAKSSSSQLSNTIVQEFKIESNKITNVQLVEKKL